MYEERNTGPAKVTGADSTRVPQNTHPVHSKHCNYRLYTFSYIVGLHCSCVLPSRLLIERFQISVLNDCITSMAYISFWQLDSTSKQ